MARTQVQSAQRQARHQHFTATSKQQHVSNNNNQQQAVCRPQSSQSNQQRQEQVKQTVNVQTRAQSALVTRTTNQLTNRNNAIHHPYQVFRPTAVSSHPDDGFESGAWLFDQSAAPQWLASQLPTPLGQNCQLQKRGQPEATHKASSQQNSNRANVTNAYVSASVIKAGSVKAKNASPDDGFESGAWLFDSSAAPQWLSSQLLPAVQRQSALPKQSVAPKNTPSVRPQSTLAQPISSKNTSSASVIKAGSVKAKNASPDDGFESGAWLFDSSAAPQWLLSQLPIPKQQGKQEQQVLRPQPGQMLKQTSRAKSSDKSRRPQSLKR